VTNEKAVSEHFIVSHHPLTQSLSLIGDAVMDLLEGGLRGITSTSALQFATRHTFPLQKVLQYLSLGYGLSIQAAASYKSLEWRSVKKLHQLAALEILQHSYNSETPAPYYAYLESARLVPYAILQLWL
jgi:hypothetical protein